LKFFEIPCYILVFDCVATRCIQYHFTFFPRKIIEGFVVLEDNNHNQIHSVHLVNNLLLVLNHFFGNNSINITNFSHITCRPLQEGSRRPSLRILLYHQTRRPRRAAAATAAAAGPAKRGGQTGLSVFPSKQVNQLQDYCSVSD
jgi:hypothetical protein